MARAPTRGLNQFECFLASKSERYTPLDQRVPDTPTTMVDLCHRLLKADPDERFQHCGEVVLRLEESGVSGPNPPPR